MSTPTSILRGGFTLLELMIATVILSMIVLVSSQALDSGMKMNDQITLQTDLNAQANAALNMLALELRTVDDSAANLKVRETGYTQNLGVSDTYTYRINKGIKPISEQFVETLSGASAATGIVNYNSFQTDWEVGCHKLEYLYNDGSGLVYYKSDGSVIPPTGKLTRYTYSDPAGTVLTNTEVITDKIQQGGFYISKVGNTLRLNLVLQVPYLNGKDNVVLHAADSQVLFLRSSMSTNLGSSPYTDMDNSAQSPQNLSDMSPMVSFGHRLNLISTTYQQISVHIAAPVGATVLPASTTVTLIFYPPPNFVAVRYPMTRGVGNTAGPLLNINGGTLDQLVLKNESPLKPDNATSSNGTYTFTITGHIYDPVDVEVTASTGVSTTTTKSY